MLRVWKATIRTAVIVSQDSLALSVKPHTAAWRTRVKITRPVQMSLVVATVVTALGGSMGPIVKITLMTVLVIHVMVGETALMESTLSLASVLWASQENSVEPTLMIVVGSFVTMEVHVQMVSTLTAVTVFWATLEHTVKQTLMIVQGFCATTWELAMMG